MKITYFKISGTNYGFHGLFLELKHIKQQKENYAKH